MAQTNPSEGIKLLQEQIRKGKGILSKNPLDEGAYSSWKQATEEAVADVFGEKSLYISVFKSVNTLARFYGNAEGDKGDGHYRESFRMELMLLADLIKFLEIEIGDASQAPGEVPGNRVFLVHGHDQAARYAMAMYLKDLQLKVTVLEEQPNEGRTIIENFEEHSDVGFAVVLLTGDDVGKAKDSRDLQLRARQNVIFELGFFIAKLGRERVCVLYSEGVEMLSDYAGVIYILMDEHGAWKTRLAREMQAANLLVDMNNIR